MDTFIVMPAVRLLQIFLKFCNKISHFQSVFRKPIHSATYAIEDVTTHILSVSDKAVYLLKKSQRAFELKKGFAKGLKVTLSRITPQVDSRMIQLFSQASVKDSTTVRPYLEEFTPYQCSST